MGEFELDSESAFNKKKNTKIMLIHAIILSLTAFAAAKHTEPDINANTTLLAARYNNNTREFEKDTMRAFAMQVMMQQTMHPDSLTSIAKAFFASAEPLEVNVGLLSINLTITDEVGTPVANVTQMQDGSIMYTIYQMPVSVNSSNCDVYAHAKVPRTRRGGNATLDSDLRTLITNAEFQCRKHISALDEYSLEKVFPGCWNAQNTTSRLRLDCLQTTVNSRTAFMNSLIARLATEEIASGLPTDRVNAEVYQKDLKNQANLAIAEGFFLNTLMIPFTVPQLRYANKLDRELRANATMQHGTVTTQ